MRLLGRVRLGRKSLLGWQWGEAGVKVCGQSRGVGAARDRGDFPDCRIQGRTGEGRVASNAHLGQGLLRCGDFVNGTSREAEEREGVSRKEGGESSKWRD